MLLDLLLRRRLLNGLGWRNLLNRLSGRCLLHRFSGLFGLTSGEASTTRGAVQLLGHGESRELATADRASIGIGMSRICDQGMNRVRWCNFGGRFGRFLLLHEQVDGRLGSDHDLLRGQSRAACGAEHLLGLRMD